LETRFADCAAAIFTTAIRLCINAIESALCLQDHISSVIDQRDFMFALESLGTSIGLVIASAHA
jgi:hypothetical protein